MSQVVGLMGQPTSYPSYLGEPTFNAFPYNTWQLLHEKQKVSSASRVAHLARTHPFVMVEATPLYKPYRYVPPQRVGFLHHFGLKTGMDFVHFGLESVMVLRELREYMDLFIVSIPNE